MTVRDLIELLRRHEQSAPVLLWDQTPGGELAVSSLGMGEVQSLQVGVHESVGLSALEVWNANDERLEEPFNGVVLGSRFLSEDRKALSSLLVPMPEQEAEALSALDWLERDIDLPQSVESYLWRRLESAADATLQKSVRYPLLGCADVSLYRAAFTEHFAKRRNEAC